MSLAIVIAVAMLMTVLSLRYVSSDDHFGWIGFGAMAASGADTFSATILPAIIEPDLIIKATSGRRVLDIDVEDVIVWDAREWQSRSSNTPDIVGGEDKAQFDLGGITKDNTVEGSGAPTADSAAQGTRPGGNGAAVTGAAAGGPGTRMNGDEQPTRFVDRWNYFAVTDEEQTAVGQLLHDFTGNLYQKQFPQYRDSDGQTAHYLMTAAHYHLWSVSAGTGNVSTIDFGASVRRVAIDFEEVMFDRAVLLSILDALVVSR